MKRLLLQSIVMGLAMVFSSAYAADEGFPGRATYPDIPVMEKEDLLKQIQNVVVVDARSDLEFDTLRIKGAVNIPVAAKDFEEQVKALRATTGKPIVFYCNGRTCMKSYIAAKKSLAANVNDVHAYDAGMFEWAQAYPAHAELLGKSPVKPQDIISMNQFKQRLLDPDDFSTKAYDLGSNSVIVDVRDKFQRGATGLFPGKERWISLDKREALNRYIEQAKKENKTIFIYDEVGHQVQWVQYALEQAKVSNYFFMHNGAKAYFAAMMKDYGNSSKRLQ